MTNSQLKEWLEAGYNLANDWDEIEATTRNLLEDWEAMKRYITENAPGPIITHLKCTE